MADQEDDKTTDAETPGEVAAEEAAADPEVTAADVTAEEAQPEAAPTEAPAAGASQREQRAAARAKEASARPPRTPAERQAEREQARTQKAGQRRRRREKAKAARAANPKPAVAETAAVEHVHGRPKVRQGTVISDKADKTITVRIDTARRHRRYEKIVRSSSTLHAHDETNDAHEGDTVRVVESRPLSRTKRWRLVEVLERAR
jgi:small subunit ribosomal protein S17